MTRYTRTDRLQKGDRIIVPEDMGRELIPVTVISTRPHDSAKLNWTIRYKRDAEHGGRRDYLFADFDEYWRVVNHG